MPLHPEAQAYLDARDAAGSRPVDELSVEQAREQSMRLAKLTAGEEVARVQDMEIPGPSGPIPLRLYYPNLDKNLPILVFFHGGGWVTGNLDTADATCRAWANAMECLIVSVNYRHAPEHKFPAAAEDAYAATRWVSEHAQEIGSDASRLVVGGQSAGGNLAAVVALMARDRGTPRIVLQMPWVPITDYNFETSSYRENAEGYGLTRKGMIWYWNQYLNAPEDGFHLYASPLRAHDFSNLPPAFIVTAQYDPLRDDAIAYAEKLRDAGCAVELQCYEGMIHGYQGTQALRDAVNALHRTLGLA